MNHQEDEPESNSDSDTNAADLPSLPNSLTKEWRPQKIGAVSESHLHDALEIEISRLFQLHDTGAQVEIQGDLTLTYASV